MVLTFGEVSRQPAPRSFWRKALERRASPQRLEDWLVDQANLRGFWGAFRREPPAMASDQDLALEELVVALLSPQSVAETRHFKLALRILQSGRCDPTRLWRLARREKAEDLLNWLLQGLPDSERFPAIRLLLDAAPPQRAPRPPDIHYDFGRLVRRPARAADLWNRARRKS